MVNSLTWNVIQRLITACTVPIHPVYPPVLWALYSKNKEGIITYDDEACIGCRYCMYACPFEVPHFEWRSAICSDHKMRHVRIATWEMDKQNPLAPPPAPRMPFNLVLGKTCWQWHMSGSRINRSAMLTISLVSMKTAAHPLSIISPIPFDQLGFPTVETTESPAEFNRMATEIGTSDYCRDSRSGHDGNLSCIGTSRKETCAGNCRTRRCATR